MLVHFSGLIATVKRRGTCGWKSSGSGLNGEKEPNAIQSECLLGRKDGENSCLGKIPSIPTQNHPWTCRPPRKLDCWSDAPCKGFSKNTMRVKSELQTPPFEFQTRRSESIPSPRTGPKPRKRNSWLHGKLQQHCRADGEKARTQEAHVKFQPDPLTECPTPPRPRGRTCYRPHWLRDCSY